MPRLLLLLPQLPHDPASGAARSMRAVAQALARAGWSVRVLATTAVESPVPLDAAKHLANSGVSVSVRAPNLRIYRHDRPVLEFSEAGPIVGQLLDTGAHDLTRWPAAHGAQFNRLFQRELAAHRPDVVFTYGGAADDLGRCQRARAAGCAVVFGLHNLGYRTPGWERDLAGVIVPSRFLAETYQRELGLATTVLPPLLDEAETIATDHQPIFLTAVNPSAEKGACFLARLAEEFSRQRPEQPMLFVESRGTAGCLVEAGLAGGFDLRRHAGLMFAPAVAQPRDFFRGTRVLLAPSVVAEAFGRVVAEALLNGVPPLVSDRGALPEAANGGGFVLPLPAALTSSTRAAVSAEEVQPWLDVLLRLVDDAAFYTAAAARARRAGEVFRASETAPRYLRYFESLLAPTKR